MSVDDIIGVLGAVLALAGCVGALLFTALLRHNPARVTLSRHIRTSAMVAAAGGVLLLIAMILGLFL